MSKSGDVWLCKKGGGMFRRNSKGFTLIELLVVVAIIGALIAILVPSLSKVRKRAKTVQCLTNVRGLVQAYNLYVQQSGNLLSGSGHGPGGAWDWQLLGSPLGTITIQEYYQKNGKAVATDKFRFCPETDSTRRPNTRTLGTPYMTWECSVGAGGGSSGSYTINNWVYTGSNTRNYNLKRLISDNVPVFADGLWHDISPNFNVAPGQLAPADAPFPNLTSPDSAAEAGPGFGTQRGLGDVVMKRHGREVNISFWDGRAESVKLPEVYNLKWTRGWVNPPPVNVP